MYKKWFNRLTYFWNFDSSCRRNISCMFSKTFDFKKSLKKLFAYAFNNQWPTHKETSQMICRANQLAGFYMREILVVNGLDECRL